MAVNIENDDYKTMTKTTTHIFQPRYDPKCQIILEKNTNDIMFCLKKKPMDFFFEMAFLFEITFANSREGLLFEMSFLSRLSSLNFFLRFCGM